ncbi:MAG TPA: tRNA (guanosine(37)-N1)-methyltransferase TrmD [Patescibacteria group bacterium]|jgi:tRNA (guanine37-N1)-methyltransferase|nr:tRNA (guanosine(37)-N1)-methyltransferase TrmD [Patescibacteria group bacterium]
MKFIILTLFPEAFESYFSISLIQRALKNKLIKIELRNLRDWGIGPHRSVDDRPYGGGAGMVLKVDVVARALKSLKIKKGQKGQMVALMTPQGKVFNQTVAKKLSKLKTLVLICGRYEGFDERIRQLVDLEISLGDFVLTGGEIPAMAVVDATARLLAGVVGKEASLSEESFSSNLLEYPHYTRPEIFKEMKAPKVLLSGNHAAIKTWRQKQSLLKTKKRRPDLLKLKN